MTALLITDRVDLLLDENNDLVMPPQWATGIVGVAQRCRIAMRMIAGEWFLDLDRGVAWLPNGVVPIQRVILGQRYSEARTRAEFRRALSSVDGVDSILLLESVFNTTTRKLNVRWKTRTVFGDTPVDSLERLAA